MTQPAEGPRQDTGERDGAKSPQPSWRARLHLRQVAASAPSQQQGARDATRRHYSPPSVTVARPGPPSVRARAKRPSERSAERGAERGGGEQRCAAGSEHRGQVLLRRLRLHRRAGQRHERSVDTSAAFGPDLNSAAGLLSASQQRDRQVRPALAALLEERSLPV